NLRVSLAPLRRARRKESVDTEWARIGVVTKKFCAKRAADFQKLLAPPPSSNGHGTGGVGTAIESPTVSNRSQPRGRPDLAGKPCFPTEASGARQNFKRRLLRDRSSSDHLVSEID
ncbi:aldose 1-epimerase family protein, partial [Prunus dulcis]